MNAPTINDAAEFLSRHSRGLGGQAIEKLLPFVTWYWNDKRCGVIREGGQIVAIALSRCMTTPEQASDPYFHDEGGKLVWVEDIASTHPAGLILLLRMAAKRFGLRETFAGNVFVRAGELRMLPWRTLERLTKGATTNVNIFAGTTGHT